MKKKRKGRETHGGGWKTAAGHAMHEYATTESVTQKTDLHGAQNRSSRWSHQRGTCTRTVPLSSGVDGCGSKVAEESYQFNWRLQRRGCSLTQVYLKDVQKSANNTTGNVQNILRGRKFVRRRRKRDENSAEKKGTDGMTLDSDGEHYRRLNRTKVQWFSRWSPLHCRSRLFAIT